MSVLLHTLSAAPSSAAFKDCLKVLQPGDAAVLMGDGVYAAVPDTEACGALLATGAQLYVLDTHAQLTGVTCTAQGIGLVDMDGLVALSERYCRQMAWY